MAIYSPEVQGASCAPQRLAFFSPMGLISQCPWSWAQASRFRSYYLSLDDLEGTPVALVASGLLENTVQYPWFAVPVQGFTESAIVSVRRAHGFKGRNCKESCMQSSEHVSKRDQTPLGSDSRAKSRSIQQKKGKPSGGLTTSHVTHTSFHLRPNMVRLHRYINPLLLLPGLDLPTPPDTWRSGCSSCWRRWHRLRALPCFSCSLLYLLWSPRHLVVERTAFGAWF